MYKRQGLSIAEQCRLLEVPRSSIYYEPRGESAENLALMLEMDKIFMGHPYYGVERIQANLPEPFTCVNIKRVRRLLRLMGIMAVYPPLSAQRTSVPNSEHEVFPYLLRGVRIELDPATKRQLNHNLLLFYTGVTRKADSILAEQQSNIRSRESVLEEMKHVARVACDKLQQGDMDAIGDLLHDSWLLKKQLASKISNSEVDDLYELARRAGATGGKIAGAGGGGFLLLYCPPGRQEHLRRELHMLQELPFNLGQDGSKVIFDYQR